MRVSGKHKGWNIENRIAQPELRIINFIQKNSLGKTKKTILVNSLKIDSKDKSEAKAKRKKSNRANLATD